MKNMSVKHYAPKYGEAARAVATLPPEEIESRFDIVINKDGTIYDIIESSTFNNIHEWADYIDGLDDANTEFASFTKIGSKQKFDDGY